MRYPKIAFIGAGHMAGYIIRGLVSTDFPADHITATRRSSSALEVLNRECRVNITTNNDEAASQAEIVVVGVKPKDIRELLSSVAPKIQNEQTLIVSIAAGIRVADLENWSGNRFPVIRVMPNLPVSVKEGVSCLFASKNTSETHKTQMESIFSSVGIALWMENEHQLDVSTVLSGSGPALFYRFMESLISGAIAHGIDADTARSMTLSTGIGALKLLQHNNESPQTLRGHVTSPGGTTAAALDVMEKHSIQKIMEEAIDAGVTRAEQMAKKF